MTSSIGRCRACSAPPSPANRSRAASSESPGRSGTPATALQLAEDRRGDAVGDLPRDLAADHAHAVDVLLIALVRAAGEHRVGPRTAEHQLAARRMASTVASHERSSAPFCDVTAIRPDRRGRAWWGSGGNESPAGMRWSTMQDEAGAMGPPGEVVEGFRSLMVIRGGPGPVRNCARTARARMQCASHMPAGLTLARVGTGDGLHGQEGTFFDRARPASSEADATLFPKRQIRALMSRDHDIIRAGRSGTRRNRRPARPPRRGRRRSTSTTAAPACASTFRARRASAR